MQLYVWACHRKNYPVKIDLGDFFFSSKIVLGGQIILFLLVPLQSALRSVSCSAWVSALDLRKPTAAATMTRECAWARAGRTRSQPPGPASSVFAPAFGESQTAAVSLPTTS